MKRHFLIGYYEQRIVYHDGLGGFYGRADIISDTGAVYDIKSATDMAKNYRYKKAVNQIKQYVDPAIHGPDNLTQDWFVVLVHIIEAIWVFPL